MYTWQFTVQVWYMYINNNNNKRYHRNRETIVSMISFIIIIINVHVPDQYSERSCIHVLEVSIVSLFLWYLLLLLLLMYMYQTCTVNGHVYMCQRYRLFLCFYDIFYYYNKNKRYHRNREAINTSDTCIHDRSLYWSGTCTLIIIIIKDIITVMYTCVRGIDCFSVSMISFIIIIIINVHVPDQYSERSCKHVSEVSIVSLVH
jgi:hypothetical protein